MAISPFKTFSAGEVLTASDLNSSFTQIINSPVDLWSPAGKAADMNGFELVLDADADSSITADTDDRMDFRLQGKDLVIFDGSTASAQNGLTILCSAAGSAIQLQAQGDDTDITINIVPKGSGTVQNNGSSIGTLNNIVEDLTPQLGGQLDVNGQAIGDGTRELLTFTEDGAAINHVNIENQAAGGGPIISGAGDDTDVPLNLIGKGTGQVQIGDAALKFPDSDGTSGQAMTTDGAGALSFTTISSKIRQVVTVTKTTTFSTTDDSGVDITGLSLSITPDDSDNTVVLMAFGLLGQGSTNGGTFVRMLRDSTLIAVGDAAGSRRRVSAAHEATSGALDVEMFSVIWEDSPGVTSATTYKLQLAAETGTTAYLGRNATDTSSASFPRGASSLIAMEVVA